MRREYSYEVVELPYGSHPFHIKAEIDAKLVAGFRLKQLIEKYEYGTSINNASFIIKNEVMLLIFERVEEFDI